MKKRKKKENRAKQRETGVASVGCTSKKQMAAICLGGRGFEIDEKPVRSVSAAVGR